MITQTNQNVVRQFRFLQTSCSQCGREFGPGDHGYSDCASHRRDEKLTEVADFLGEQKVKLEALLSKKAAHTPGPIHLDALGTLPETTDPDYHSLKVGRGFCPGGYTLSGCITRADAERIRDCWNQHDELVAVLKGLLACHGQEDPDSCGVARAAIARAEATA